MTRRLMSETKKELRRRLEALGFKKGNRDGVYRCDFDSERIMYVMCRPRVRSGYILLDPLIAIENLRLRRLIGEDEPRQAEPRIAHVFLSYTIDPPHIFWAFSNTQDMRKSIDGIENALRIGGVPFAQRWTPFRQAVDLIRRGFSQKDLPQGVVTHPTRDCRTIIDSLPETADPIH